MDIYLAGGAVRDLILGHSITDRDYLVTNTSREEFVKRFPNAQQVGRTFPIFLINKMEFSFPRGNSLDEEVKSRDLTVNALLLNSQGDLICHPRSLEDLKNKVLRPASKQSFIDDPLRVFRAARFWAKFPDFTPHASLLETMHSVSQNGHLDILPADRIGQETIKALNTIKPGNYIRLLTQTGCLSPWFDALNCISQSSTESTDFLSNNIVEHTAQLMDKLSGNAKAVWMGLCHGIGKRHGDSKTPFLHTHDINREAVAKELASRIRLSNALSIAGAKATRWHMAASHYDRLPADTRVDLLIDLHLAGILDESFDLVAADNNIFFHKRAHTDLETILTVNLKSRDRNLGPKSGEILRAMRAKKLAVQTKK
ncbi:tRNA nucleotidyltransferase [Pseudodesulfovibrio sp. zrk46]|uniref:tRNA nucleotidyltransferase n=1 Tax=Pseudodesulfovibrio sp. zrk46 TaxID=2725288 RepID=UPI001448D729|nr:tRNA nucleotidyltransferase [Pseudodesulfovibrio sp. zrk46]QJB57760.1 tRNA nucleotidyltransferase [Pseudodesulfovibrio sp. zrk46]